jgi:transcriptional regulator with XRE-family HTH domain
MPRAQWPDSGFGGRLRALREAVGMDRHGLARRAGCSYSTIMKLEQGVHEPIWSLALSLARALGVTTRAFEPGPRLPEPEPPEISS